MAWENLGFVRLKLTLENTILGKKQIMSNVLKLKIAHDKRGNSIGMHGVEFSPGLVKNQLHQPKSHPLPTPTNLSLQANHQSQSSLLALLEPSKSAHNSEEHTLFKLQERLPSPAAYILPMPALESEIVSSPCLKAFSLDVLSKATANFSEDNLLVKGVFGCLYKGWLDRETLNATSTGLGEPVAIKKLIRSGYQGLNEWLSEVNHLRRIHHPNLVKLIGYCSHGEDRILVYEFLAGGNLEKRLFKRNFPPLSWAERIKVATGAAQGLCFLHEADSTAMYRDFKTSDILLDMDFNAKLSDFGYARVMGTEGYCDPYYLTTGRISIKCDIYSFGVVLLEMLSGRQVIDTTKCQEEKNLVIWVKTHFAQNRKVFRIMDTKLEGQYCKKSACIDANVALCCLNPEPTNRPPMTYILEMLENLPSQKKSIDFR